MSNLQIDITKCIICDNVVSEVCSGCGKKLYCSKQHMKEDFASHVTNCCPYSIVENNVFGRYLIATRDIKAGEIIFKDQPCVLGPRVDIEPICYNCYTPLYVPISTCKRCSLVPMCHSCKSELGHSEEECNIFSNALKDHNKEVILKALGQFIVPLRCILKLRNSAHDSKISKLLSLESHVDERRGTFVWESHHENVVKKLHIFGITTMTEKDVEYVQKICGIVDVNCFEVRGPMGVRGSGQPIRGLYVEAAMMAHNCVPNIHLSIDDKYEMVVRASSHIPKGEAIVYNYTSPLQRTEIRQEHLKEGKYFLCNCKRCTDPTELATHLSSLMCVRCKTGFVVKRDEKYWGCNKCEHKCKKELICCTITEAEYLFNGTDPTDARALEKLLMKFAHTLSPNHSISLDIKQMLVTLYREVASAKALQRKIQLCNEILIVLMTIDPGISRLRGITLYELHVSLVGLAQIQTNTDEELKLYTQAEETLRDAIKHLIYEPLHSPEGNLQRQAMSELKLLRGIIQEKTIYYKENCNNISSQTRRHNKKKK
uniref:SET domain-containing protein n=1 Tax=Clastoptera arizonana TaxID=38151 RepID=A0A1B6C1U0_9HEMI